MSAITHPANGGIRLEHMFEFPRQTARMYGRDSLTDGEVIGRQTHNRTITRSPKHCVHSAGPLTRILRGLQVRHERNTEILQGTRQRIVRLFWAILAPDTFHAHLPSLNRYVRTLGCFCFFAFWLFELFIREKLFNWLFQNARNSLRYVHIRFAAAFNCANGCLRAVGFSRKLLLS